MRPLWRFFKEFQERILCLVIQAVRRNNQHFVFTSKRSSCGEFKNTAGVNDRKESVAQDDDIRVMFRRYEQLARRPC